MITLKLLFIHRGDDSVSKLLFEKEQELGFSLAEPTQSWEWSIRLNPRVLMVRMAVKLEASRPPKLVCKNSRYQETQTQTRWKVRTNTKLVL